jgi:transcriptional regulator with XRE-family HTH domain
VPVSELRGVGYPSGVSNRPTHVLVAENLGRITEAMGITLADVATRAGMDPRELFAVLAGQYDADLDWLRRIAAALEVNLSDLVVDLERDRIRKN